MKRKKKTRSANKFSNYRFSRCYHANRMSGNFIVEKTTLGSYLPSTKQVHARDEI